VSKYLPSIWVQSETPPLRQESPDVTQEAPDDLQETPDDLQETPDVTQEDINNRQGDSQVRQVDIMAKYSWRDLPSDEEATAQLLDHFCRRSSERDPVKPGKADLFKILLKYIVALGNLTIVRFEEGIPILRRGDATHVSSDVTATRHEVTTDVTLAPVSEDVSVLATQERQSQSQLHAQQTPSQLALDNTRLAKMAYVKATRIAQERTQEAAQEAERIKQDATADSRKAKKEERYRATMAKLGKLPPCPKIYRGEECSGIPCEEERASPTHTLTT
jgi:hypothetical protein